METFGFKTLNYLGSKLRLIDFIEKNISAVASDGECVCDLFAGSGCVSYRLSQSHPIISCDIQEYSQVICEALLNPSDVTKEELNSLVQHFHSSSFQKLINVFKPLIDIEEKAIENKNLEILADVIEYGSIEVFNIEKHKSHVSSAIEKVCQALQAQKLYTKKTLITRYYGGVYFSYKQAVFIDGILELIHSKINPCKKNVFLAALLSTVSEIADTVGKHFAQPLKVRDSKGKIKTLVYSKAIKDKTVDVQLLYKNWLLKYINLQKSGFKHQTMRCDFLQCLRNLPDNVKTIYADPPYTREHYSRYYHVLETIVLRDSPQLSTVTIHGKKKISNGIYRQNRFQSPFCIKSKALGTFNELFEIASLKDRNLILSYSPYDESKKTHPRVVTIQQLLDIAQKYYRSVNVVSAGHFLHNKLNSSSRLLEASDEAEILIVCTTPQKRSVSNVVK